MVSKRSSKRRLAEAKGRAPPGVRGLYVLTLTADEMSADALKPLVQLADGMLRKKDARFARLMEQHMRPEAAVEIAISTFIP